MEDANVSGLRAMVAARTGREEQEILTQLDVNLLAIPEEVRESILVEPLAPLVHAVSVVDPTVTSYRDLNGKVHVLSDDALRIALEVAPNLPSYHARGSAYSALGLQPNARLVVPALLARFWSVVPQDDPMEAGERWSCLAPLQASHAKAVPFEELVRIVGTPEQVDVAWLAVMMFREHPKRRDEIIPLVLDFARRGGATGPVLDLIRKLKAIEARNLVVDCLKSENSSIRANAAKTLAILDKN